MKESSSFRKRLGHLCLAAFTALAGMGIAGCNRSDSHRYSPLYGPPPPHFHIVTIHGTVKQSDGAPVEGIKVTVNDLFEQDGKKTTRTIGTGITDDNGMYALSVGSVNPESICEVAVSDIDGAKNGGTFAGSTRSVRTNHPTEINFTLKPKQ